MAKLQWRVENLLFRKNKNQPHTHPEGEAVAATIGMTWCPETESNRHVLLRTRDFKSRASASFAIRALGASVILHTPFQHLHSCRLRRRSSLERCAVPSS